LSAQSPTGKDRVEAGRDLIQTKSSEKKVQKVKKMDDLSRRKFLKQFAVLSAGVGAVIFAGCEPFLEYGPPPIDSDPQDTMGNLFIYSSNTFGSELVLYDSYRRLKIFYMPRSHYRVNVPGDGIQENELQMFKYYDVDGNLDNPPTSELFKRWSVILPTNPSINPEFVWIIDDNEIQDCGELVFINNTVSDINVEVNLLISERMHTEQFVSGKPLHLGMTYGEYTIEYTYWIGNSPKAGERRELGRITTEIVNGAEIPIRSTLNTENNKIERTIPNWEG